MRKRKSVTNRIIAVGAVAGVLGAGVLSADTAAPKQALNANYTLVYNTLPGKADSFAGMFQDGVFYGRLRTNNFYYTWEKESASQQDQLIRLYRL